VFSTEDLLTYDLDPESDESATRVLDTWRKVHNESWNSGIYILPEKGKPFRHLLRSCAALVILSLLVAFFNLAVTLISPGIGKFRLGAFPVVSYTVAVIDTGLAVGSFVCAFYALMKSEYYPESANSDWTVGFGLLLGAGALKFASIPMIGLIAVLLILGVLILCVFITGHCIGWILTGDITEGNALAQFLFDTLIKIGNEIITGWRCWV